MKRKVQDILKLSQGLMRVTMESGVLCAGAFTFFQSRSKESPVGSSVWCLVSSATPALEDLLGQLQCVKSLTF